MAIRTRAINIRVSNEQVLCALVCSHYRLAEPLKQVQNRCLYVTNASQRARASRMRRVAFHALRSGSLVSGLSRAMSPRHIARAARVLLVERRRARAKRTGLNGRRGVMRAS